MANQNNFDEEASRKRFTAPYTSTHPVPTVQKYREDEQNRHELQTHQMREGDEGEEVKAQNDDGNEGIMQRAVDSVKNMFGNGEDKHLAGDPYPTQNRYEVEPSQKESQRTSDDGPEVPQKDEEGSSPPSVPQKDRENSSGPAQKDHGDKKSATETAAGQSDPRQKRKAMKHTKRDDGGREVTDPVTHLPVVIHDSTGKDLKKAPENEAQYGSRPRTSTGLSGASKSQNQLDDETRELQDGHQAMQRLFPGPDFEDAQTELIRTYHFALTVGLGSIVTLATFVLVVWQLLGLNNQAGHRQGDTHQKWTRIFIPIMITVLLSAMIGSGIIWGVRGWLGKRVGQIWEEEVWDAARSRETEEINNKETPESTQWLNSLLASVWPLINPDLFTSLADTLEDVMQASLPKLVRMISVDDLGQGSEAFRILGIRWLPTGAASRSVSADGELKSSESQGESDRTASGEGEMEQDDQESPDADKDNDKKQQQKQQQQEQEEENIAEGMEAEQGDFVNMEVAFAYRARTSGKSLKTKAKNAHLYLKFYLPGGIALPVWVEMRGIIGTMRMRLQLTPDPPFIALATITFLGQPKANLSCVPLSKHSLNLMDLPLISSFVQSSIDAALAEYVAPKSLTLDLKDMLMGDDFKKDTTARGVLAVYIKAARDFKEGDGNLGALKAGSSDSYVTCGYAKFAKPVASTRIILSDQRPTWNEWSYVLVGPDELNADEFLRLELWDSDRTTADDALGRVEVELKDLMRNHKGKMHDRKDKFVGEDEEPMPGTLQWSVGYFPKTRISKEQLINQNEDPNVNSVDDLKKQVSEAAEHKLREATRKDESKEIFQQKAQDYKEREDALIMSSPPSADYPSGIFSIQIHNITGLEFEALNKSRSKKDTEAAEDEAEESDDLPSSYCTVILNHAKIFKTRTKPKNAKPFFNAGCERFLRDWRTTEVMLSVRDSRVHENDPLLGIVYLPLAQIFKKRSQLVDSFPLVGGIGYGRARISMVFRSIEMLAPRELLGWDYGTLEVKAPVKPSGQLPDDIKNLRIKLRSTIMRAKMRSDEGEWRPKHDKKSVYLAVRKRYSAPLVVEFRKSTLGPDSTPAFGVFWLKDLPDEEVKTVTMQIWKGGKENLKRAQTSCEYDGMEEGEQPLGEIDVTMKFWRGLSGYHKGIAQKGKEQDLKDVMEVLDTANDNKESDNDSVDDENASSGSDSSDSDFDDDDNNVQPEGIKEKMKALVTTNGDSSNGDRPDTIKGKVMSLVDGHNDSEDGSRGPLAQIHDYKDHHKQLHRRHRGLMQWKGARTVDWMMTKATHGKDRVKGTFKHNERGPGIETEV